MRTQKQQKLVGWLRKRKVATLRLMQHQFQLSRITVLRNLKKYGYLTSYNQNASYYTLHDVPQFDEAGLWSYRNIRFSKFGTLTETIVAVVQNAPAGMTVGELQELLKTQVANLLCRLVQQGRLTQTTLQRRQAVYLAADAQQAKRQYRRRQQMQTPVDAASEPPTELPPGLAAEQVIQILRQMVLAPSAQPDPLARQLVCRGVAVTAGQVEQVVEHYALKKK